MIAAHSKVSAEEITSFASEPEFEWEEVPRRNGYVAKWLGLKRQPPKPRAPDLFDDTNVIATAILSAPVAAFMLWIYSTIGYGNEFMWRWLPTNLAFWLVGDSGRCTAFYFLCAASCFFVWLISLFVLIFRRGLKG